MFDKQQQQQKKAKKQFFKSHLKVFIPVKPFVFFLSFFTFDHATAVYITVFYGGFI